MASLIWKVVDAPDVAKRPLRLNTTLEGPPLPVEIAKPVNAPCVPTVPPALVIVQPLAQELSLLALVMVTSLFCLIASLRDKVR